MSPFFHSRVPPAFLSRPDFPFSLPFPVTGLLAVLGGMCLVLSMPPWDVWGAIFAGFGLFFCALRMAGTARAAFACGWLFGMGYFVPGLFWIGNALLVEGSPYAWARPLAVLGLPALLSVFPALAALICSPFLRKGGLGGFFFFCAVMGLSEWARGNLFTGFPWNLYGFAWTSQPALLQFAALGGIYGLSFLTIFWGTLPAALVTCAGGRALKMFVLAVGVSSFAGAFAWGAARIDRTPGVFRDDVRLVLVQPHIPQEAKWDMESLLNHYDTHLRLSAPETPFSGTTLIVWPETAVPSYLFDIQEQESRLREMLSAHGNAFLATGILRREAVPDSSAFLYYNSLVVLSPDGALRGLYDKAHLVPFGEYIPFARWIPLDPIVRFSGFVAGEGAKTISLAEGLGLSPLICYEIIFPAGAVSRNHPRPHMIVNVTNDAWYGNSAGPYQHFQQARLRAIETGLPVIRSANTGISGVIDPAGRIVAHISLGVQGVESVSLPERTQDITLYMWAGDIPLLIVLAGILISCVSFAYCKAYNRRTD